MLILWCQNELAVKFNNIFNLNHKINKDIKALMHTLRLAIFFVVLLVSPTTHAALEIEISGGSAQQLPVAVVPFAQVGNPLDNISNIIAADLKRSGMFRVLETGGVASRPADISQIKYAEWTALQAQAMSVGKVEVLA